MSDRPFTIIGDVGVGSPIPATGDETDQVAITDTQVDVEPDTEADELR